MFEIEICNKDVIRVKRESKSKPASVTIRVSDNESKAILEKLLTEFPVKKFGRLVIEPKQL